MSAGFDAAEGHPENVREAWIERCMERRNADDDGAMLDWRISSDTTRFCTIDKDDQRAC